MARKIPAPMVLAETGAYWQAANEERLLVKHCNACGQAHHYPRDICPHCLSSDTEWRTSTGAGTLYSYSTMGQGEDAYTIAFVTLDEGVTLMTNLLHSGTAQPSLGSRVEVCFLAASNGQKVPMFTLKD